MGSIRYISAVSLLVLCALLQPTLSQNAGTVSASSSLSVETSNIAATLSDSTTMITASLSLEASSATSLSGTTSAASSIADSTTSAASTIADSTTSAVSTIMDSTTSAASTLAFTNSPGISTSSTTGGSTTTSTSGAIISPCGDHNLGEGCDDPHFIGFDGSVFDFQGISGDVFNIVSDSMLQVNALFLDASEGAKAWYNGATWMLQVGVKCFNDSVTVSSPKEMNVKIAKSKGQSSMDVSSHARVVNIQCGHLWNVTVTGEQHRWTHGWSFKVHAIPLATPVSPPHGVLGQTMRYLYSADQQPHPVKGQGLQGKGVVQGEVADYIVKDGLLGNGFKFNKFSPNGFKQHSGASKRSFFKFTAAKVIIQ